MMDPRHQNRLVLTLVQAVRTFSEKRIVVWWCAVTGPRSKKMPSHPLWPFPLDVQAWRNFLHQAYTRHRHKLEILRIDLSPPAPSRRAHHRLCRRWRTQKSFASFLFAARSDVSNYDYDTRSTKPAWHGLSWYFRLCSGLLAGVQ